MLGAGYPSVEFTYAGAGTKAFFYMCAGTGNPTGKI